MRRIQLLSLMFVLALAMVGVVPRVSAAVAVDSSALRNAVTAESAIEHLEALQSIANSNNGIRASGTPGYTPSADYVADLMAGAGYNVTRQEFQFPFFRELSPPVLEQTAPGAISYVEGVDFQSMEYSGSGDVTGLVQAVDLLLPPTGGSTSGCEAADFAGFVSGRIALIQRGTCTFAEKVQNASAAGAAAVIIFNEGNSPDRTGLIGGTLGGPVSIPVLDVPFDLGNTFNSLIGSSLELHIASDTISETRTTENVIAETPGGRADRVVVVGAHLDSVPEGPGINDNGSGSALLLEVALKMAELNIQPRNQVRFAFWGAEEAGLLGSEYYVSQLSNRDIKNIAVNLNFDMVASPNFVRFVYDGDGNATGTAGPNGSKVVEDVFSDYFAGQGLEFEATAFDGRSDYGPFINVGIPAGGLFTGAEGIKTAEEAAIYGGTAGDAYDSCYHQSCDTIDNINAEVFGQMLDAAAHATLSFAQTTSAVNGTDKGKGKGQYDDTFEYRGAHVVR